MDVTSIIDDEVEGKLVRDAYAFFKNCISQTQEAVADDPSIPSKKKNQALKDKLTDIRDRLLSLLVNAIYLDNEDDAYVAFETLNSRGKDLEIIDLVKNLIMRNMREVNADLDLLKEEWKQFVARLGGPKGRQNHNQLIYHSWISRKAYISQKKSFSTIKKSIGRDQVTDYWDELREDAKIFARIQSPNRSNWNKQNIQVIRSLTALGIFGVTQPTPLLLSLIRAHDQKKITAKTLKSAIRAIECFHFTFTAITGTSSSGGISAMYAALARQLHQASDSGKTSQALTELKRKLGERMPKLDVFSASFVDLQYGTDLRTNERLIKYVLAELDYFHRKDDGIDYSLWTVEHICAQSDKSCSRRFDIGNLILVSPDVNKQLGTQSFARKREILKKSGYYLDQSLKSAKAWGDEEIASRGNTLAQHAHGEVWAVK